MPPVESQQPDRVNERDIRRFTTFAVGGVLVLAALLLLLWNYIFVTILPGHVGVLYSWLQGGTRVEKVYGEGLALKLPWNRMYIVETRIQTQDYDILALTQEGMVLKIDASVLYRVRPDQAAKLVQKYGPEYVERVVRPVTLSYVREAATRFNSHELYTADFRELERQIHKDLAESPYSDHIEFSEIVLRRIRIPDQVARAIEDKLSQEQLTAAYYFRIERERQEAERKRIEAIGIQNFYSIVSEALTPNLLTWRGIQATVDLAGSPNSKVVVVGGGKNQMPLILGGEMGALPTPKPVQPISSDSHKLPDWDSLGNMFPNAKVTSHGVSGSGDGPERAYVPTRTSPQDPLASDPADRSTSTPATGDGGVMAQPTSGEGLQGPPAGEGFRRQPTTPWGTPSATGRPYGITE